MTCDEAAVLLHALIDGELDASHAREIETHAAGCARCAAELATTRELRQALNGASLHYTAPASLRGSIDRAVPSPTKITSRRSLLTGFALGSLVSAAAAAGVPFNIIRDERARRVMSEAVSAHLRSLQAEHLTDVLSSERHTVKPWFNGRIDLAPPVINLTGQGFTLIGGRLDYIDGKPVAAIVYRRRVHVINLFVMQETGPAPASPKLEIIQGFNIVRWTDQGLNLLAISDLAPRTSWRNSKRSSKRRRRRSGRARPPSPGVTPCESGASSHHRRAGVYWIARRSLSWARASRGPVGRAMTTWRSLTSPSSPAPNP